MLTPIGRQNHRLGSLVNGFMAEMHRYDGGRTLPLMHAAKLTTPQLAVLEWVRKPRTVSAIAEHLGLSRPATSQLVDKLVRRKWVRRAEGTLDRRQRSIQLSPAGKALVERIAGARAERFQSSLAVLPIPLAAQFAGVLVDVVAVLTRAGGDADLGGAR